MAEECCAPGGNIMILACSGGSNVDRLSNGAAVELTSGRLWKDVLPCGHRRTPQRLCPVGKGCSSDDRYRCLVITEYPG